MDRLRRGAENGCEGDDDRLGRQRTIRGQRSDDQTATTPALRGTMSDSTTQFTVPAAADAIAAAIGDREFDHSGRPPLHVCANHRAVQAASGVSALPRPRAATPSGPNFPVTKWGRTYWASMPTTATSTWRPCSAPGVRRVAPFNVNYRYVKNELQYLLADSGATALIYHAAFAPRVGEVLPDLPRLRVLIQIADDSGNDLLARRRGLRDRSSRPGRRSCRRSSHRPTTCTCSTPAARLGCRKACCGASTTSS